MYNKYQKKYIINIGGSFDIIILKYKKSVFINQFRNWKYVDFIDIISDIGK